jgi:Tfp pilus assembly protein PilV
MSQLIKKVWLTTRQGFLLVEVILATALFVILSTAFISAYVYGQESTMLSGERARAALIAQEGLEAVKSMRDSNFTNLTDGTHGLAFSSGQWIFQGTQDIQGIFTRMVTISPIDADRKDVSVTVTWQQRTGRTGTITLSNRFTNWQDYILNPGIGILVNKTVINHGLTLTSSDFGPFKVGTTTVTLASSTIFPPGTYTVSETTDSRYNRTFTGDCNASGQITIATTSTSKSCTITNEEKVSYVTLYKNVINHTLSKTINDFAPYKVGTTVVTPGATTTINSGSYSISEATSSQYATTYSGDCFTNGTLTIGSGENKVCTITNEEIVQSGGSSLSGLIIYGDGSTIPKYRTYNNATDQFSAETQTFLATVGPTWIIRTSPNRHLAIAGYYDSTGTLTIMCFDGATWYQEFTAVSGGVGNRHRFDIAFEESTGDALVVFSKGGTSGDTSRWGKLGYRTKTGGTGCGTANWSSESIFTPARTTSDIMYVRLAEDRRATSSIIAMAWVDINDDISTTIWSGTAWTNEPTAVTDNNVERVSSGHDVEDFDLAYESKSGDLMLVWANGNGANGTNGVRYRTCTGGGATCTWGNVTTPPTFADDATNLDISANPLSDEIVFASIGNAGSDLQMGYWSGTAWTDTANADTSCGTPFVGSKLVTTGWLVKGTTTRSVVVYSDSVGGGISWYTGNQGTFTLESDFVTVPSMIPTHGYMDIQQDPNSPDQFMFITSDNANDLYAKRLILTGTSTLTWSNSDGGALETTLPQTISSPFSFTFWRQ